VTDAAAAAELPPVERERDNLRPLIALLAVAVVLWVLYWTLVVLLVDDPTERGQFGDLFGGINALFSAGAFAGLIYTVLLQRKELRLQREELTQTREELKGQKVQLEIQNSVLRQQSFENTFFEMMRRHEDIVNAIEVPVSMHEVVSGRRAFGILFGEFERRFHEAVADDPLGDPLQHVQSAYTAFFAARQSDLGHYFRNLYHMVKLVADRDLMVPPSTVSELAATYLLSNRRYSALIRAQLSSYEHLLLFYNGLSTYGFDKFKPLIERFALLENMPWEQLLSLPAHANLYVHSAYGEMVIVSVTDGQ
jgi:hypothetical protein